MRFHYFVKAAAVVFFSFRNVAAFSFLPSEGRKMNNPSVPNSVVPSSRQLASTTTTRLLANNNNNADDDYTQNFNHNNRHVSSISLQLNPLEKWCITHMDVWYSQSLSIKCPFFRRRMADLLDGVDMMMRFVVIRHKSLDLIGPPPGCRSTKMSKRKHRNLSMEDRLETIRHDWRTDTDKGYYITGRLNTTMYRDDCLFDGPDPDMPVRGLRKYLNAASHLFDHATSTAELLSLETKRIAGSNGDDDDDDDSTILVVARWKLQGVLHLPWHPELPIWTGSTTYHFDEDGLIQLHEESWDISVLQAFTQTLWPEAAELIWDDDGTREQPTEVVQVEREMRP
jgi:hypothetical protein